MHSSNRLLIATRNTHKQREFGALFATTLDDLHVLNLGDWPDDLPEVVEDAPTFEGNALKKALEMSLAAGVSVMAEDSGLAVDVLDGAPGVYSARYSGEDATTQSNNAKLSDALHKEGNGPHTGRFVSVIALALCPDDVGTHLLAGMQLTWDMLPHGRPTQPGAPSLFEGRALMWVRGELEGHVRSEAQGDQGFGYDPHFFVPSLDCTLAQMSMAQKNAISHRGKALAHLKKSLKTTP